MTNAPVFAVLTAAGSGTRLGEDTPKALVRLLDYPMLTYAAQGLIEAGVAGIVVTAPETHIEECAHALHLAQTLCKAPDLAATCLDVDHDGIPVAVVPGGSTRQASVAAGLAAIPTLAAQVGCTFNDETVILIHDAARALTPIDVIQRVIEAVRSGSNAVIPALPVTDTLKVIDRSTVNECLIGSVSDALDRSALVAVQTPQGFTWIVISRAHTAGMELAADETLAATDDAGLIEALGGKVDIVLGDSLAMKITTPWDLRIARLVLRNGSAATMAD